MFTLNHKWQVSATVICFIVFTLWWIILDFFTDPESASHYAFGALYGIMALWGGISGISIALKWGGVKSLMGKAVLLLASGLLFQEFGQIVFSYYNIILKVQVPYPSVADIGFFGNIPLYAMGVILLGEASNIRFSLKKISSKLQAITIPALLLTISYWFFLRSLEVDWTNKLKVFLDFGYPLGQATYISLALLTYTLTHGILGGVMKKKIFIIVLAFVAQYIADYNFLFQSSRGTWVNGGYGDYLYFIAYFVMTLGLLQLGALYESLRNNSKMTFEKG